MTRGEFERRWDEMPELKRAELINGMVLIKEPTRFTHHGEPHAHLTATLGRYTAMTPGVFCADAPSVRLDEHNEPQPDVVLLIPPEAGGRACIDEDDFVAGGPELIAEVSGAKYSIDLHDKMDVYRRHGVREYVVWRVSDREIDWFVLRENRYERVEPTKTKSGRAVYQSSVFPGLWLDFEALLARDLATVFKTIDEGVADPAHAEFANHLKNA
jgi:Uma2 family endonuclease